MRNFLEKFFRNSFIETIFQKDISMEIFIKFSWNFFITICLGAHSWDFITQLISKGLISLELLWNIFIGFRMEKHVLGMIF